MENKTSVKSLLKDGILTSNPLFVSLLGLCPAIAVTGTFMEAVGMTIAFFLVLLASNVVISLLRKFIPNEIRIPIFIIIVATFVTCVKYIMWAWTPELYDGLKTFIALIVVNCIVLGRAEVFASKNSVGYSAIDAISQSIGFGFAIIIIALFREILGTQTLTLYNPFNSTQSITLGIDFMKQFSIPLFDGIHKYGAFIAIGIIIALFNVIKSAITKNAKKGAK